MASDEIKTEASQRSSRQRSIKSRDAYPTYIILAYGNSLILRAGKCIGYTVLHTRCNVKV